MIKAAIIKYLPRILCESIALAKHRSLPQGCLGVERSLARLRLVPNLVQINDAADNFATTLYLRKHNINVYALISPRTKWLISCRWHFRMLLLVGDVCVLTQISLKFIFLDPVSISDKQRVLMHRHQGWNVRHGLCHIYMRYLYIYMSCL